MISPAILVASPRHTGSMPVASGSRLPTWPALMRPKSRRTLCRAALEDSPRGLSSSTIPAGIGTSARFGIGGRCAVIFSCVALGIFGHRAVDEAREALGALHALVEYELQARA